MAARAVLELQAMDGPPPEQQAPAPAVPPRAVIAPRRPTRNFVHPFPFVTPCNFDLRSSKALETGVVWEGLRWIIKWSTYRKADDVMAGRVMIVFSGMKDRAFTVDAKIDLQKCFVEGFKEAEIIMTLDKDHNTIVIPNVQLFAGERVNEGMLSSELKLAVHINHIEFVDAFTYNGQKWPMATSWLRYKRECSVRMRREDLKFYNPQSNALFNNLRNTVLSKKEADAFYNFAGVFFHRWLYGTDSYHQALLDAYKLGFTENWETLDTAESYLDFHARTMLPLYQHFMEEEPSMHKHNVTAPAGNCQIFELKLNPSEVHSRFQTENMNAVKGHRGQWTFYLEDSPGGLLLMAGACFQVASRQLAKIKLWLFENGHTTITVRTNRIVHDKQRTVNAVVAILTEEQLERLVAGEMKIGLHLYFSGTEGNFVHNHENDEDRSTPFVMPGPITGWIMCNDGKKIGICKEYLANHCEQLNMLFYNTIFADCGKNEVTVTEDSSIVLDALSIVYHRSLALRSDNFRNILELGGYWLSKTIHRFIEIAILKSDLIEHSDKVQLAIESNFEVIKYKLRHPEYSDAPIPLTATELENIAPASNELDGIEVDPATIRPAVVNAVNAGNVDNAANVANVANVDIVNNVDNVGNNDNVELN